MKMIHVDMSVDGLTLILKDLGWMYEERIVNISTPGAGNMNVVIRVKTDKRTFILKQSRPYVQKYQDIPAPTNRIDVEYQFYKNIASAPLSKHIPDLLHYSKSQYLLMMEDLGECHDMSYIYHQRSIHHGLLEQLIDILQHTHGSHYTQEYPDNHELKQLNHQHIFVLPFLEDNGFRLDDVQMGLQALSKPYKKDDLLKTIIKEVGDQYMSKGDTLIHGDYYPGSWMSKGSDVYMIDPEFSFVGFKEFDLGVMIGHLIISTQDGTYLSDVITQYGHKVDVQLVSRIAGIEIMRRLIGLAQLPIERSLEEKNHLMRLAYQMITSDTN